MRKAANQLTDDTGTYAVLAISPGFTATRASIAWLGRRIATHGFVVITIDTNSTLDQPPSRATQLIAALRHVTDLSNATVRSRVDAARAQQLYDTLPELSRAQRPH